MAAPALTVPALWRNLADQYADRVMLRRNGVSCTYADVDRRSAELARGLLAEGVGKGARIGVLAPNGADWVVAWLAANRVGAIAVCLSTLFTAPELAYGVAHADVSVLLSADRHLRHDYVARLEEAFPSLVDQDGAAPLALREAPYLRGVWFTGEPGRRWSRGSFAGLEALGRRSKAFDADFLAAVENCVAPADLAMLIYTSGSTAQPKGVAHTQATLVRKPQHLASDKGIIPFDVRTDDRLVITAPFFWVGGLLSLTGAMMRGARLVCVDDHSPQSLLEAIREEQATHLSGGEATFAAISDSGSFRPGDFSRLRPQTASQFSYFHLDPGARDRVPKSLGMTETMGPHSGDITGRLLPPEAAGAMSKALAGMEYKIVDPETGAILPFGEPGELCLRGAFLMVGMYKKERAEVFDADGFYHTGDRCTLREDGYLFFHSRISGMIKTSGANVSPEEVEVAIARFEDVTEAAVMGLPDPKAGQIVVAAVVRRSDSSLDERELKARLRGLVSSFKVPKRVFFFDCDELPRTPSNKIRKPPLARLIAKRMAAEAEPGAQDKRPGGPTGAR